MGSAASTLLVQALQSNTKKPLDACDLVDPETGRQDRLKALAEIKFYRHICRQLLDAATDDPKHPLPQRYPPSTITAPTIRDAHQALQKLVPKRKLDFETLSKLPHPCTATRICATTALQLCLDDTRMPTWQQTQAWLKHRPYNDVRFTRIEENPSVWISFETTISALTNLIDVNPAQLEKLAERGKATKALFLWSLAVCSVILERQDGPTVDADVEKMKEELWGRAWEWGAAESV